MRQVTRLGIAIGVSFAVGYCVGVGPDPAVVETPPPPAVAPVATTDAPTLGGEAPPEYEPQGRDPTEEEVQDYLDEEAEEGY